MKIDNLAIFAGKGIFSSPRSTSNLIKPDKKKFLNYLKSSYLNGKLNNHGDAVSEYEKRLSELHGTKHCIAVCNGLWGLVLTIYCLKKEGRNEIVMPSLTYRRMADIAAWLGLVPNYCDVDKNTLGITAESASKCINDNTALILAPHPIVNLCDVSGIEKLAMDQNLPLLFDSVEASYADHDGKPIGSFGNAECFSVHASKFLNGFEGGYITTNNDDLAFKLRTVLNNGINENGIISSFGMNAKLSDLHASMTLACLDGLENQIEHNKLIYYSYKRLLEGINSINLVEYSDLEKRGFKNILIELKDEWPISRENTISILQAEKMVVRPYYYPPLHDKSSVYRTITGDMSNTNDLKEKYLLLPCGEFVSPKDVEIIVKYLKFIEVKGNIINNKINQ